ncbi:hypothetical protein GcM1_214007 [Golovinomyces cichoracearum]|uniref:Uncharacterized protein n=1 Tax=Golovinomyces cichoracearum TaxID=62708 RepID=A0A420ITY3_9PEZI|nr:hypothetical protein GcM1_214007 [Golovinomyces cichoracearum]
MANSAGISRNLRGYDSWIDISSQPSSPSQSPVNDEIVTTGLRIQNPKNARRRRKCFSRISPLADETRYTSSQEEYEESESDEDHILAGSDEHIVYNSFSALSSYEVDSDSDRGKRVKTLPVGGTETRALLDPQHDIFSQHSSNKCQISPENYLSPRSTHGQHPHVASNVFQQQMHRRPADHDAALRASLTTLLSIGAAAARGLPKREFPSSRDNLSGRSQENNESIGLRFMSESELLSSSSHQPSVPSVKPTNVISSYDTWIEKKKPKRSWTENTKKMKSQSVSQESAASPTFLTWAVSAGVLVIMSVFGFGAGYLIGRDAGRQEIMAGLNVSVLSKDSICGRGAISSNSSGFKNFKWGVGRGSQGIIT